MSKPRPVVLALLAAAACSEDWEYYSLDYSDDVEGAPIASNANLVKLNGSVALEKAEGAWSCEVFVKDQATVDRELAYLTDLTSDSGDVIIADTACALDAADFDEKQVFTRLDVSYRALNLVYGDGEADLEIDVLLDRKAGTGEAFVVDYLLCIDGECVAP